MACGEGGEALAVAGEGVVKGAVRADPSTRGQGSHNAPCLHLGTQPLPSPLPYPLSMPFSSS